MKMLIAAVLMVHTLAWADPSPTARAPREGRVRTPTLIWDEQETEGQRWVQRLSRATARRSPSNLRVAWWNINHSILNSRLEGQPLDANLISWVQSDLRPDVLVLGECGTSDLEKDTHQILEETYPWSQNFGYYSHRSNYGFRVYSRLPILDFSHRFIEGISLGRAYVRITLQLMDDPIDLVLVHFENPWREIRARASNPVEAAAVLQWGLDHPIATQLRDLAALIQGDSTGHPRVVLGDFNLPRWFIPGAGPTASYALAIELLGQDALRTSTGSVPFTFPSLSAPERRQEPLNHLQVAIDHAFISHHFNSLRGGALSIRGSDHYPILMDLNLQTN
jgi:endonuclease/exonuclease/phosphatase family metal-dependent hydrolase